MMMQCADQPGRPKPNSNLRKWTAGGLNLADGLPLFQCW